MLTYYFASLGVIPLFIGRAFVPLFGTALLTRVGPEWSWVADSVGIQLLAGLPEWVSSDTTLTILGVMALIEVVLAKIPEAREFMIYSDAELKGVAGFLTCFFLVEGDPMVLIEHLRQSGLGNDFAWGQPIEYAWSFGIGWLVWFGSALRRRIYGFLVEIDEDDSLGVQGLLSWAEDGLGFFGVLFAIILPAFAMVATGLALLGLYMLRRYIEATEQKKQVPCPACGTPNHMCGVRCSGCRAELPDPHRVGFLGTVKDDLVIDQKLHRFELRAQKRCPSCADRLKEKSVDQSCSACETRPFQSADDLNEYMKDLRSRLPRTILIAFGMSMIPVLGLLPGIIYCRISLIASLQRYVPPGRSAATRWGLRVLNFFLICMQPIPFVGALALPLICYSNFSAYRGALSRQASSL